MADYYTQFATSIELPNEAAVASALELLERIEHTIDECDPESVPDDLADFRNIEWGLDMDASASGCELYLSDGAGTPNMEAIALFLQQVIKRFDPAGVVAFEYSNTCSKSREDGFGGGGVFVTGDDIEWKSTFEWVSEWKKDRARKQAIKEKPDPDSDFTCTKCGGADVEISVPALFKLNEDWKLASTDVEAEALSYFCADCQEETSVRCPDGSVNTGRWD